MLIEPMPVMYLDVNERDSGRSCFTLAAGDGGQPPMAKPLSPDLRIRIL
ncbi:hypothetical protein GCM10007857_42860 [Bradyrhizobium iriomotense]|uniref:Uncharacterized protein n=1 Tax=Bradyrhizobium iriomotense TaxID=441950 RepID=A0ABQ6AZT5_9BRAD|nr:hypothetical protein GCM10007857_42860 [Bradyrhizobium iriomotense]